MTQSYSVSYWQAHQSTLDAGPTFNISDTAADISASGILVALNGDHHIGQIIVSNNQSVVITVAEFTSASTALSILTNANGSVATLTVDDTAADIQASFATIGGHATVSSNPKVTSIIISDNGTVTLQSSDEPQRHRDRRQPRHESRRFQLDRDDADGGAGRQRRERAGRGL
jgi:hypothetical protein